MRKHRYPGNRKVPRRHTVKKHTRAGKSVRSYHRGKGAGQRTNRVTYRRRIKTTRSPWNPSVPRDKRRRALLASIPKNISEKRRLRKCAERLQKIALDSKVDKATRMKANADYDYFVERIQKFQNPAFGPAEKAEYTKIMNRNWELGRHEFEAKSFEDAHRKCEAQMREEGWIIDLDDTKYRLAGKFGIQPTYN